MIALLLILYWPFCAVVAFAVHRLDWHVTGGEWNRKQRNFTIAICILGGPVTMFLTVIGLAAHAAGRMRYDEFKPGGR